MLDNQIVKVYDHQKRENMWCELLECPAFCLEAFSRPWGKIFRGETEQIDVTKLNKAGAGIWNYWHG